MTFHLETARTVFSGKANFVPYPRLQPEWDGCVTVWGFGHFGVVPVEKLQQIRHDGATLWWTTDGQTCIDTPYCAVERLLPHYCFKHGAEAYEFWGIDWLTYDPYVITR